MSLREERDTQTVYTGSILNQEATGQSTKQSITNYTQTPPKK